MNAPNSTPARVYISYDFEQVTLRTVALGLANDLRKGGVLAVVDVHEPSPSQGWPKWREQQLREADFVVVVCTSTYRHHFESDPSDAGGHQVRWEAHLLRQRLHDVEGFRARVLPVLLEDSSADDVPDVLRSDTVYALPAGFNDLYRCITRQPAIVAAPLGQLRRTVDNLPPRPPVFEGRDDELAAIRDALAQGGTAAVYPAIVGMGGVGKTRLALEHAFDSAKTYDVRWRVRAGAVASLQEDLVELGQTVGIVSQPDDIDHAAKQVLAWLSSHERWLVIFDNAESRDELRPWLPTPCPGHALITSRDRAWRGVAKPIEVTRLTPEAAVAVLVERSGLADDGHANALAHDLGYLPLALIQAGAYMEATGCSLGGYRERLEQHGVVMFSDPKAATGDHYQQTVARTWEVSLAAIRQQSLGAAALLDWLAFLDPDGVPLSLLREHAEGLPEPVRVTVESSLALDDALAVLLKFSMVDREGDAVKVHRLVQAVTRERLGETRDETAGAVVDWVRRVFAYDAARGTSISHVPDGFAEQVVAVSAMKPCVQVRGSALARVLGNVGHYRLRRGMLSASRDASERSQRLAEELAKTDPDSAQAQRDLSVSLDKLGDVEVAAGNLAGAREHYARSLQTREELARADPDSAQAQRDLSVSLEKLGNVEVAAGNLAGAREHYARSLQARQELEAGDPDSAQAQRDLSVSLNKLGDVERRAGNLAGAREHYARSLQVAEELARADPDSAQAQRDLSISLNKLGDVERRAGNLAGAREHYARSLQTREELARADPDSAQAQRDLSISLNKLGDVERRAGNLAGAREHYARSLQTREELARADPDSAQAQRDLSISLNKLGDVERRAGNLAGAREHYARSLQTREELARADPDSAQAQRDLSISLNKLGDVEVAAGNLAGAREHYARGSQTREELARADPDSAQAVFDVCISQMKVAEVAEKDGDRPSQQLHLRAARAIVEQMDAKGMYRGYAELDQARRYIDARLPSTSGTPAGGRAG